MISLANPFPLKAEMTQGTSIEYLRIAVPSESREAWLKAEKESWEPWLLSKKGFLGRQLLWDEKNQEAIILISWASRKDWKSILKSEIDQVQKHFEEVAREQVGSKTSNPFPLKYEGELLPQ